MIKKLLYITFLTFILIFNISKADIIKKIQIDGNDRISDQTVILFSGLSLGADVSENELNEAIKKLYETSFFDSISISLNNNVLIINLEENPLIQTVDIQGIKKKTLIEAIKKFLIQKEKSSFVKNRVQLDQNRIINALRTNGYYFSKVSTKIKNNENNTVDIIYQVELGNKALIKNIKFVGNKIFKDNKLRKVIASEEAKFWKFLSNKKNVNIERFKLDENLLRNFYKNSGYYNVKINSSFAQVIEDKEFEIIFNIDAGNKYLFNNINLNIPEDYNKADFEIIENILINLKSKPYSLNRIEDILDEIEKIALTNNYEFVSASYKEEIIGSNKIDLSISLIDTQKFYVDKINIYGNYITSERVVRNQFLSDEGDPFNEILVNKSFNNIKSLNIFKNVETNIETNENKLTKVINVTVEEKPTGEIFAGAGTGTSGSSLSFGISENNYGGEGIKLGSNFSVTEKSLTGSIFLNEPNYKNSNRSLIRSLERTENDNMSSYGYKTDKTGFSFGTSYEQYRDIFFSPTMESSYEDISTNSLASASKKKQQGSYLDLIFDYDIVLNKLNQNFNPTDGYKFAFTQELPIYSEDYTIVNRINYSKFFETDNNLVFSFSFFTAAANSLSNDDARITKRIFIPTRKLRGFESGKIGPKDGGDYIGGNYGTAINLITTLPDFLAEVQNLDVSLFFDAANVWGVDYSSNIDENSKIRSATGVAIDWFTPIGPLSLSYAFPITKNSTDVTEEVRFNIGTTF